MSSRPTRDRSRLLYKHCRSAVQHAQPSSGNCLPQNRVAEESAKLQPLWRSQYVAACVASFNGVERILRNAAFIAFWAMWTIPLTSLCKLSKARRLFMMQIHHASAVEGA